jgi:GDP-L-fucose synthase
LGKGLPTVTTPQKPLRLFIAGNNGMVGSALVRRFQADGRYELVLRDRRDLDLASELATQAFFQQQRPEVVIVAAARVGGIEANRSQPVEFLADNLRIAVNTIQAAYQAGVKRLLFLGSTCVYPRDAGQPIAEASLLTSSLETTNEAYALAKIAGLKLCQYYRRQYGALFHSAMPTNLYGPGDNYHPQHSHVLPGLIRRFHEAAERGDPSVMIWGTGRPRREFLHVDDLASAIAHLIVVPDPPDWVNVGTGVDQTIMELAQAVARVVGYAGEIATDPTRPDGTPQKLSDVSLLKSTGWRPQIELLDGIASTYQDFLARDGVGQLRAV